MASVLPPPAKRQRRENLERTQKQQDVTDPALAQAGTFHVSFVHPETRQQMVSTVEVPVADATEKNLSILLNTMLGREKEDFLPYTFTFYLAVSDDLEIAYKYSGKPQDLLEFLKRHGKEDLSELLMPCTPEIQSVFRVKPVRRLAHRITGHSQPIIDAKFSPESSTLFATACADGTARIWDTLTGTPKHRLPGHKNVVQCLAWSPDGEMLATGGQDATIRIWNPNTGKTISGKPFKGHRLRVNCLAWQPYHLWRDDSSRLASSSKDESIRIWIVNSGVTEHVLGGHTKGVGMIKWGGLDQIFSASQDATVRVWDAVKGTLIHVLKSHTLRVNAVSLSTDFVLRTGFFEKGSPVPTTTEEKKKRARERFEKVAKGDDGQTVERLVSASDDNTLFLWEPSTKGTEPVARLLGHQSVVIHTTFSPDGAKIASSGFDKHTKLWNGRDGSFLQTLVGHVARAYQSAFSADSRFLVTGSKDTTLKIWSMSNYKMVSDLPGHEDEVYAVDWAPDGERVGSGGKDSAVRLWRS